MLKLVIALASVSALSAQPSVKEFGAVGDGVHDDSPAFALALKSLDGLGGALRVPKGIYNLGRTGIAFPKTFGGIRLIGDSATATRLVYHGEGAAIQLGAADGVTYGHTISDLQVDITHAGINAVAVRIYAALYVALIRLYVTSSNSFSAAANGQMGIVAIGGTSSSKMFGAYLRIEDPRLNGRFKKGIYFTAPEIGWGFNSCILEGGAIVYPGPVEEGTIGIHIEQGNQNVITLMDVEQYAVGIRSDAYANTFMGSRTEGNGVGLILTAATREVTGGSYNKVFSGFHGDGLVNHSQGSQIIATDGAGDVASVAMSVGRATAY